MASKIFFSHQKVYFWISAFDHRAIVEPKMHIVQWPSDDDSNVVSREQAAPIKRACHTNPEQNQP